MKSKLFEFIIYRCKKEMELLSVDGFFLSVVRTVYSQDVLAGLDEDIVRECKETKEVFDKYNIDLESTLQQLSEAISDKKFNFVDTMNFAGMCSKAENELGEQKKVLNVPYFIEAILRDPPPLIKAALKITGEKNEGAGLFDIQSALDKKRSTVLAFKKMEKPEDASPLFKKETPDPEEEKEEVKSEQPAVKNEDVIPSIMKKVDKVRKVLQESVYGQDHAISTFVSGYFQAELSAETEQNRTKPRATFLFAGPPGVGKTFMSEQAAKAMDLPFKRFDMSEYSAHESDQMFSGSNRVYKNSKPGLVTEFVSNNPRCVLLFDEIEKAHLDVIHLFLQILDAGRLRDNYTDEEISFADTIIIFTTNAGKKMYEDESINLTTVSKKSVLRALGEERNPNTDAYLFPPAICSRFAMGNVVMFNRMGADFLLRISAGEMKKEAACIAKRTGIDITLSKLLPYAVLFAEGGKADARTIKGKSKNFIYTELYELIRLVESNANPFKTTKLKKVSIDLTLPDSPELKDLFEYKEQGTVLVFTDKAKITACKAKLSDVNVVCAETQEEAKKILEEKSVSLVLCDLNYNKKSDKEVLNIEDIESEGMEMFSYLSVYEDVPVYALVDEEKSISSEEKESLLNKGLKGIVALEWGREEINSFLSDVTLAAHLRKNMLELAKSNKVLFYNTEQRVAPSGEEATISLFGFKLVTAVDAGDNKGILDDVTKPKVKFDDVIGAKDAKDELSYFVRYLKNPTSYLKKGVKAPKGILLYGPPGTGKTLLAKALAGESDVTFIASEGNSFLKKFVGEGTESVHNLFAIARKYAPSILFIDEIDAIAIERGSEGVKNGSDDVLTAFLTEMDGFNTDEKRPVFVLAATNYIAEKGEMNKLDPALMRRFDRRIYVGLPNKEERILYLEMRISKLKYHRLTDNLMDNIAMRSTGMSLAELDSVFELALRNVIKADEGVLTDEIFEDAFETFNSGAVKKWDESELLRTARHEAGHALICRTTGEDPTYLTIVARGSHGGYMQHESQENKGLYTRKDLLSRVRTALGGRAAEMVCYGEEDGLSSGASGDLQTATRIMRAIICDYGMDEEFGLCVVSELSNGSGLDKYLIEKINAELKTELKAAMDTITRYRPALDGLVEKLMQNNALKADEIAAVFEQFNVPKG